MLGELGRLSCLDTRHGSSSSTFRRRILRGGYIAWRILRGGTSESHAGWSFAPSAEGAMTKARLTLYIPSVLVSPSCQQLHISVRVVTHSAAVI